MSSVENISIVEMVQQIRAKREAAKAKVRPGGNGPDPTAAEPPERELPPVEAYEEAAPDQGPPVQEAPAAAGGKTGESVVLLQASDITPEPICWLWNGWIAKGKLHILAGPPGGGKTNLILAIAAALTIGGRLPSGETATPCNVVMWSGEDSPEDTLIPRLMANGADRSHIYIVSAVKTRKGINRSFDPAVDMPLLREALTQIDNVGLLIVDSVASVVLGDSHKNNQVRRALQPLVDLATERKCAAFGITHLTKGSADRDPIDRLLGSIAFGALARLVLMAVEVSEENGGGRLLIRVKSNIGPDGGGYQYDIHRGELDGYPRINTSWTLFGDFREGTPRDLLALAESIADPEERGAVKEAKDFITQQLANGPALSAEIELAAESAGIAVRTLKRGKKILGVTSAKGFDNKWRWYLPTQKVGTVGTVDTVGTVGTVGTVEGNKVKSAKNSSEECQECQPVGTVELDMNQEVNLKSAKSAKNASQHENEPAEPGEGGQVPPVGGGGGGGGGVSAFSEAATPPAEPAELGEGDLDGSAPAAIAGCKIIYAPAGQAGEYAPLATNPYRGCGHSCAYCYVPNVIKMDRAEFNQGAIPRQDFLQHLIKDARRYQAAGITAQVMLSFTTDPYHPGDTTLTRDVISVLQAHGLAVCTLTKGGSRALRDLDLFRPARDAFASTLTSLDDVFSRKWEPNAALPGDRIATLKTFHEAGIFTWVSLEPTLDTASSLAIIEATHGFVDLFKIGRANYLPMTTTTNWQDYTRQVVELVNRLNVRHYIKRDLQPFLPSGYPNPRYIKQFNSPASTPAHCHDCLEFRPESAGCHFSHGVIRDPAQPPCGGRHFEPKEDQS